LEIIQAQTHR